jgi:hypothetical protein
MKTNKPSLEKIDHILAGSAFRPFRYVSTGGKGADTITYWQAKVLESLANKSAILITEETNDSMDGFILIKELNWDSRIFNARMASIDEFIINEASIQKESIADGLIKKAILQAGKSGYQFLLCKVFTDDIVSIHALEKAGFLLVDTLLDYQVDFKRNPFASIRAPEYADEITIRFARESDDAELAELARAAFANHFGRYHSDARIPKVQATQTYIEWMHSSLHGYADYFVLAEIGNKIAGLSIWKKTSEMEKCLPLRLGHYSIGAIHPEFFGKKLFSILTYEGMKLLQPDVDMIEGPTHINNYAVQRGYSRLGWQIGDARHSFHKWLD